MFDWLLFLYGGVDFEGESIQEKLFVFLRNVSLHFSRTKGGTKTLTLVNPALPSPSTPTHPFSSSLFFLIGIVFHLIFLRFKPYFGTQRFINKGRVPKKWKSMFISS